MRNDTPATSPDPETSAEGDTDQLAKEDMLLDGAVGDLQDEGLVPPDHQSRHRLETELENYQGDSLDDRLAQEEPEVWEHAGPAAGSREADRAGRLAVDDPDVTGSSTTSLMATDAGISGGAASAEEAAMHVLDDDALG